MSAPDPSQHEQMPTSSEQASADPSSEHLDDAAVQRALEETEAAAKKVEDEASAEVDNVGDGMFATIESFLDDLEGRDDSSQLPDSASRESDPSPASETPAETAAPDIAASTSEPSDDSPQDEVDDAFAQAMAEMGDDAMAAPAEIEAEAEETAPAESVASEPVIEKPTDLSSAVEFPASIERPDVALDASSDSADEQPADLTLDDELSDQLDDFFQTDMNDLDEVLNDVFGPEEASEHPKAGVTAARPETPVPNKAVSVPRAAPAEPHTETPTDVATGENEDDHAESFDERSDDSTFDTLEHVSATGTAASITTTAASTPAEKPARAPGVAAKTAEDAAASESTTASDAPAPMVVNAAPPRSEVGPMMDSPLTEAIRQILFVMNRPVQRLPESKRTLVSWFALTLAMWVPIVWIAVWYLYRP